LIKNPQEASDHDVQRESSDINIPKITTTNEIQKLVPNIAVPVKPDKPWIWGGGGIAALFCIFIIYLINPHMLGVRKNIHIEEFQGKWVCRYKSSPGSLEKFDGNSWEMMQGTLDATGDIEINGDELIRKNISMSIEATDQVLRANIINGNWDAVNEITNTGRIHVKYKRETHSTIIFESPNSFVEDVSLVLKDGVVTDHDSSSGVRGRRCERSQ
jgi:hypothetical protein